MDPYSPKLKKNLRFFRKKCLCFTEELTTPNFRKNICEVSTANRDNTCKVNTAASYKEKLRES